MISDGVDYVSLYSVDVSVNVEKYYRYSVFVLMWLMS